MTRTKTGKPLTRRSALSMVAARQALACLLIAGFAADALAAEKPVRPDPWIHPFVAACRAWMATGERQRACESGVVRLTSVMIMNRGKAGKRQARDLCLTTVGGKRENGLVSVQFDQVRLVTSSGRVLEHKEVAELVARHADRFPNLLTYYEVTTSDAVYRHPNTKYGPILEAVLKYEFCQRDGASSASQPPPATLSSGGSEDGESGDQ